MSRKRKDQIVIVGGGFGGLYAVHSMKNSPVEVTLIDRRNFHLFQPLLYQVATGGLSPEDIASPLRSVLKNQKNARVLSGQVIDIDPQRQVVILEDGHEVAYDALIIATGASHHYFGRDAEWEAHAPGLKTIEDAIKIRRRVLLAFEAAERERDPDRRRALLTFVIVGGGPTGVELAGALGELAQHTMREEFRSIDTTEARINLIEGLDRILFAYPEDLSAMAAQALGEVGVTVQTNKLVTDIADDHVLMKDTQTGEQTLIPTYTVLWGAGVKASPLGEVLARRSGAELDSAGRVMVGPDLTVGGHPDIFVIGDLAHFAHQTGQPLPGVAQVAMQMGQYVADVLRRRRFDKEVRPFRYKDKGMLAVIGRNRAVADIGRLHFGGFMAWLIWVFVHIGFLIEFDNKVKVMTQWGWNYVTRRQGARLITGETAPVWLQLPIEREAAVEKAEL
ncbi:NADH dehydrogenase, FAD-containing subunit [Candidatus Promineifilum breve]|uniref:NADH:ubiquinone reductase (non-electrogenic) n=1 Tax=Candidatus Promineifilum breve TaxID=1806508 RepID=A0A160T565_9CHLR|nr:NAD(P)/FAD-dependent oxidoreductase [Candidatus Promineifilum breve]CUS03820.2 NADH dehydrogenase, FAD-containing subunit [Candidatus Promineifilum breve]